MQAGSKHMIIHMRKEILRPWITTTLKFYTCVNA